MNHRIVLRSAFAFAVMSFLAVAAHAAAAPGLFRAYISSTGSDANPCTLPAPCRLLPAALAAVADGGEIWMLDSANYNTATVTIGKSVSILAIPGAVGSVVAIAGPAVLISAAGLTVALRNLVIVPLPASGATDGVLMTGASTLTIENSLIANLPNAGVNIGGTGKVEVANSIIRNNGQYAVRLLNGASAGISSTKMLNNAQGGVFAWATIASTTTATVSDSVISGGIDGVYALSTILQGVTNIFVTRCTIQNTNSALHSETTAGLSSALIAASYSMITNNGYGWLLVGAQSFFQTLGNNHLIHNTLNIGTETLVTLQ